MMEKKRKISIPLELIVDAIEMADDEWKQYLDIEQMEIISLPEYPFGEYDEDDDELEALIEIEWRRFLRFAVKV